PRPLGKRFQSACVFVIGMKPPPRRRAAPARYLGEVTGPATWSAREKRQLVRLLQARQGQPEPDAAELARELRGRSEAEIRVFLQQLKGRVAREAIQKLHPGGLLGPRRQEAQPPAPIEVWMDLAEKITGPLEEALAVAFSQVQPSPRQVGVSQRTGSHEPNHVNLGPGPFPLPALWRPSVTGHLEPQCPWL
ncbi:snRNA-activating protein complex subunit 2, partial [Saguinus oedipus]